MNTKSQIFDIARFGKCLKRDLTLDSRSLILKCLLMLAVTTTILLFATWPSLNDTFRITDYDVTQREGCFFTFRFCGFVFCMLGASLLMDNMTIPGKRINTLMSPASSLEKYLSRIVIYVIGVTAAYLVCFSLADLIRYIVISIYFGPVEGLSYMGAFQVQELAESKFYLWGFFFAIQATFVLGSTIWPKGAFIKTFGMCVLICIIGLIASACIIKHYIFTPGSIYWLKDDALGILEVLIKTMPSVWAVFCYITAYFRMRESEIINRL